MDWDRREFKNTSFSNISPIKPIFSPIIYIPSQHKQWYQDYRRMILKIESTKIDYPKDFDYFWFHARCFDEIYYENSISIINEMSVAINEWEKSEKLSNKKAVSRDESFEISQLLRANILKRKSERKFLKPYKVEKTIGRGTYSTVFQWLNETTQQRFAVKYVNLDPILSENKLEKVFFALMEMQALTRSRLVKSDWFLKLYEVFVPTNEPKIYFRMELCLLTLKDFLVNIGASERTPEIQAYRFELFCKSESISSHYDRYAWAVKHFPLDYYEKIRSIYSFELIASIYFLHQRNIVHRDLTSDNVLIDQSFHVKLADFNVCKLYNSRISQSGYFGFTRTSQKKYLLYEKKPLKYGNEVYRAPELNLANTRDDLINAGYDRINFYELTYDFRTDWFSIGLILLNFYFFFDEPRYAENIPEDYAKIFPSTKNEVIFWTQLIYKSRHRIRFMHLVRNIHPKWGRIISSLLDTHNDRLFPFRNPIKLWRNNRQCEDYLINMNTLEHMFDEDEPYLKIDSVRKQRIRIRPDSFDRPLLNPPIFEDSKKESIFPFTRLPILSRKFS